MQLMPGTIRDPGFGITPMRADTEEENRRVGQEYLDAMYRKYVDQATALAAYNWGPGNVDKWLKSGADPKKLPSETKKYISNIMKGTEPPIRKRDINTVEGQVASAEDIFGRLQQRFGPSEEERASRAKLMARAEELTSDEYQDKMRKDSMWQTLAAIGFNMASSKSPSLLQAIGEAASAALPGAVADKKERKALKDRGLELMVELGAKDRKEAIPLWNMATEAAKTNMQQQQFVAKQDLDERQLNLAERKLNAEIKAMNAGGDRISFDELLAAQVMSGAISEPMAEALLLRRGGTEGGGQTVEDIRAKVQAGRTGGATPTVIDFKNLN
jgi:hypothetical protein